MILYECDLLPSLKRRPSRCDCFSWRSPVVNGIGYDLLRTCSSGRAITGWPRAVTEFHTAPPHLCRRMVEDYRQPGTKKIQQTRQIVDVAQCFEYMNLRTKIITYVRFRRFYSMMSIGMLSEIIMAIINFFFIKSVIPNITYIFVHLTTSAVKIEFATK